MDDPKSRKKKNSKDKKNKELNGKYSSRHVRLIEKRFEDIEIKNSYKVKII